MSWHPSRSNLIFGALFGGWLGFVVAFSSQAVNWLFLPGIPLAEPGGNLTGFVARYVFMGMLMGLISAIPEHRIVGAVAGSAAVVLLNGIVACFNAQGYEAFMSTLITMALLFLPLSVLLSPLVLLIRMGVDARHVDPARPYLWPRRFLIPVLLTLVAVIVGSFSLYSREARSAFRSMDEMTRQGMQADSQSLPAPLEGVKDFSANARGAYTLEWSDRVETFFGPVPVGGELSQFLIIARFENGFAYACIFSNAWSVPSCTNY